VLYVFAQKLFYLSFYPRFVAQRMLEGLLRSGSVAKVPLKADVSPFSLVVLAVVVASHL
jgi:hypothetical protein